MTRETIRFRALDGYQLTGDLFVPDGRRRAIAVVAGAMGVPRKLYAGFAAFLAESGVLTLTLDYRGMGDSKPPSLSGFHARFSDWAELDLSEAIRELRARSSGEPLLWVGHSAGGQLLGLLPNAGVSRALLFASQSGYFGHWSGLGKLGMAALWHVVMPAASALLGYFPGRLMGGGDDLPRGVAEQWAQWGRSPDYILSYLKQRDGDTLFHYSGPLLSYGFTDDWYAPRRAVQALLTAYGLADGELRMASPADLNVPRIGHFGAFREALRPSLWSEARDWLLAPAAQNAWPNSAVKRGDQVPANPEPAGG